MEQIKKLLMDYYLNNPQDLKLAPWSSQYAKGEFPKYWDILGNELNSLPRDTRIIEVGCGLGDVTTLICGLGFQNFVAYERNKEIYNAAVNKIGKIFNLEGIIRHANFPSKRKEPCDVLIIVNCVYGDEVTSKHEYKVLLRQFYECANCPKEMFLEVIDQSFIEKNPVFPEHIRLSQEDVEDVFPNTRIQSWRTYEYPINKSTKTLYKISKI